MADWLICKNDACLDINITQNMLLTTTCYVYRNLNKFLVAGPKKIPVVPVLYREKISVGRSEIIF
jgi:hypothetical protein